MLFQKLTNNPCTMRCSVVLLKSQVFSLNDRNNMRQQNFITILLPRHHAIDNTQRTSSTVPDSSPYQHTASSVAIMLLEAAGRKPLASKSMNVDATIVEIECKPRFIAPHHITPSNLLDLQAMINFLFFALVVNFGRHEPTRRPGPSPWFHRDHHLCIVL